MRLTGITTYIFDMDDTMYEEMQYVRAAMEHVAEYVEREHGIEKERIYLFCMDLMEEQGRGAIFDMMIEEFHLKESVEKLVEVYRDTRPSLTLYGDAEALLKEVERQGLKTGLITDGNAKVQKAKAEGLNLMDRIQSVVLTDAMGKKPDGSGYHKPDPEVFLKCLKELGANPEDAVYIGDNPAKDFIGARKLGMKTVQVCRNKGMFMDQMVKPGYEADMQVSLLTELL